MKAKIFAILVCGVMLFGISCSNDNLPVDDLAQSGLRTSAEENEEEPVIEDGIIPFSEEFQPEWYRIIRHILPGETLAVINSLEEFEQYVSYPNPEPLPEEEPGEEPEPLPNEPEPLPFDFSEKTLLLAYGGVTGGISDISKEIVKEGDEYSLTVKITRNNNTVAEKWLICLLVDKIEASEVTFNLLKEGDVTVDAAKLIGVKWKLKYFVSVENGEVEPSFDKFNYGPDPFWITFNEDLSLKGKSSTNSLFGNYSIELPSTVNIQQLGGTKIGESEDGNLFVETLRSVRTFILKDGALLLYYNETDYLHFIIEEI